MKANRSLNQICVYGALLLQTAAGVAQPVTKVAAGHAHSLFLKGDGSLWGMGNNSFYQLGDGTRNNTNQPILMASNVTAMAGGRDHTLFALSNGSLWAMGANNDYQLGDGTGGVSDPWQTIPEQIEAGGVTAVDAGYSHSLFIKDGGLWVMGRNVYGQLGNGTFDVITNFLRERIVESGVTAIAAGDFHSLFLKSDGSLWGMGGNTSGQLGVGIYSCTWPGCGINRPTQIVTSNVTAIAAGNNFSLFLKSDGSLWAMGNNGQGQLGDGSFNTTNRPIQIVAGNVTAIAAGNTHSLFLKSDGSLWGMGQNSEQLGLDIPGSYITVPTQIVASGVMAIAAGQLHSLFAKCDGSLWAMGDNGQGQLGNGSSSFLARPGLIVDGSGFNRNLGELSLDGRWRFSFVGIAGMDYALERAFNLLPSDWVPQETNVAGVCGLVMFTNTPSPGTNNFWRVRSVP